MLIVVDVKDLPMCTADINEFSLLLDRIMTNLCQAEIFFGNFI
jgi:hypothetical protein